MVYIYLHMVHLYGKCRQIYTYMDPMGFHIPGKHREVLFFGQLDCCFFGVKLMAINSNLFSRCLFLGLWGLEFSAFEHTTLC